MKLNFGGLIPVSTVDWYGKSAAVIFFNGCPLRCIYCQNHKLLEANNPVAIEEIEKKLLDAKNFISAVVFSGGEPAMQFEALEHLAGFSKKHGLRVGIETNGYYPERLEKLVGKKLVDKLFLDIKAWDSKRYNLITGSKRAAEFAYRSLELKVPIEVRTTVFRSIADIKGIARFLESYGCTYVIQQGIPENAPSEEIRKEKAFTRDELLALARSVSFLKDVRIRTREKGEEKVK